MSTPGIRIKERRKSLGLTQPQVGAAVKVSKATVSLWENDTNTPNGRNLQELAKCLDTSSEWILSGKSKPASPGYLNGQGLIPFFRKQECPASNAPGEPIRFGLEGYRNLLNLGDSAFAFEEDSLGMEPRIMKGEAVVIELPPFDIVDGGTYLVDINGDLTLAYVHKTPAGLVASFLNPAPGWGAVSITQDDVRGKMAAFIPGV